MINKLRLKSRGIKNYNYRAINNTSSTFETDSYNIPTISIIIPTLNEEKYIKHCIESLINCNYPKDKYEIIVVDNGSTDDTVNIAKTFNLKVFVDRQKTIGGLRNLGCKEAKGTIYGFLDADCTVDPNWIKNAVCVFSDKNIGVAGNLLDIPHNANWVENTWFTHLLSRNKNNGYVKYINTGNCFIRKEIFEKVGGFSEILKTSEDVDICEKIKDYGYKIYNSNKILAFHFGYPKTIKNFLKREIWHGIGSTQKNIPYLWKSKPLLLSIYNIILLFATLLFNNYKLIIFALLLFFLPSIVLAIRTSINTKKPRYILGLIILYNLYGVARTISLILIIKKYVASLLFSFKKKR